MYCINSLLSLSFCLNLAMNEGDEVSVYVDLEGACRKGLIKHFEGKKMFVGNGVAKFSRQEVFCSTTKLRFAFYCAYCYIIELLSCTAVKLAL